MKYFFIIIILFIGGCTGNDKTASTEPVIVVDNTNIEGETLFKNNCASCHKCDKDFTGPALKGSLERWGGDKKTMYEFIRNPAKSIVENAYAKQLFEKWNRTMMTAFPFSDAELDAIVNYCEAPIQ